MNRELKFELFSFVYI